MSFVAERFFTNGSCMDSNPKRPIQDKMFWQVGIIYKPFPEQLYYIWLGNTKFDVDID